MNRTAAIEALKSGSCVVLPTGNPRIGLTCRDVPCRLRDGELLLILADGATRTPDGLVRAPESEEYRTAGRFLSDPQGIVEDRERPY